MNFENKPIFLSELLAEFPGKMILEGDPLVTGITSDSRKVDNGYLFVALSGKNWNGHKFIPEAIMNGASAIVGTESISNLPVPYLQVDETRESLAFLSSAFFRFPARELTMIGVTGTDGKTTTCHLIHSILTHSGYAAGVVSTVNALIGGEQIDTGFHVTTPEAPDVQRLLRRMVNQKLTYAVIETTSHSLSQKRVIPTDFNIGVCTNITHEHLDYHQSFEAYRLAKASLFEGLSLKRPSNEITTGGAVINFDDPSFSFLKERIQVPLFSYGFSEEATFRAGDFKETLFGSHWSVSVSGDRNPTPVATHFFGRYNVHNCLAAIAVTVGILGLRMDAALDGIRRLVAIPGRMEKIDLGQDFLAFVDFAHTPNALQQVLMTARKMIQYGNQPGRIIAVFGSAGLRDQEKRRLMAEVSADYADFTILTAEDPRTEDLSGILREMTAGMISYGRIEGKDFVQIPDRGEAIQYGVDMSQGNDILLVCGKGHEQSMCFGEIEYLWDDRLAVRVAIKKSLGMATDEMPYLPTRKG